MLWTQMMTVSGIAKKDQGELLHHQIQSYLKNTWKNIFNKYGKALFLDKNNLSVSLASYLI